MAIPNRASKNPDRHTTMTFNYILWSLLSIISYGVYFQNKMKWLRTDMRNRSTREQKLRNDLRDAINANENDRQYLLTELAKREDVLDELSVVKHGKAL